MKIHGSKQADLVQAADCQSATLLHDFAKNTERNKDKSNQLLIYVRGFVMNMTELKRILLRFEVD